MLSEPMQEMFTRSIPLILDFSKIPKNTPPQLDIRKYFVECNLRAEHARSPQNRQKFNNAAIAQCNTRYLVSQYAEDRVAMLYDTPAGKEGRTFHMGIDIFATNLEPVRSPCSGRIVRSGYEDGYGEYGNYVILKPDGIDYYIFFGHLANDRIETGTIRTGQLLGHLGDYLHNENGGWSRHLHVQILQELPSQGSTPIGYSAGEDLNINMGLFPDPMNFFPEWRNGSN